MGFFSDYYGSIRIYTKAELHQMKIWREELTAYYRKFGLGWQKLDNAVSRKLAKIVRKNFTINYRRMA